MSGRIHEVKAHPVHFREYGMPTKPFSIRKDDRGYQAGDRLHVMEWHPADLSGPGYFTGVPDKRFRIAAVHRSPWLATGYCILALETLVNESDGTAEAAYRDRNLAVMAWATALHEAGRRVGWRDRDAAWPILMMDLPTGQVSYHIPREEAEFASGLPDYPDAWDGHDLLSKQHRVLRTIEVEGGESL